ncbi:hypothetical protein NKH77_29050 [Streptomyces sp. M19]
MTAQRFVQSVERRAVLVIESGVLLYRPGGRGGRGDGYFPQQHQRRAVGLADVEHAQQRAREKTTSSPPRRCPADRSAGACDAR